MNKLTKTMEPRCFGRYLIDLPSDMKLGLNYKTIIDRDIWVEVEPISKLSFELRLRKRESDIREERLDGKPNSPSLKEVTTLEIGKIFDHAHGSTYANRTLELHAWHAGYAIKMWVKASDFTGPEFDNEPKARSLGSDVLNKRAQLLEIYSRVRGRADTEVPTEPGVCVANGFIRGAASDGEDISMNFLLTSMPDVYLHVETDSGIKEDTTLLDRGREINAMTEGAEGRTMRKGARKTPAGVAFEEWLIAGNTNERHGKHHVKGHTFTLEGNSKIGSAKTPLFIVELHNGERESEPDDGRPAWDKAPRPELKQASLSEAEALALWDAITSTLRPRPGAF